MTSDAQRPQVLLHSGVAELLSDEQRAAIELITYDRARDLEGVDVSGVRFMATGPAGFAIKPYVAEMTELEVWQTASAGVDWAEPLRPAQATLCSATGGRDAPVAEWVLGALLGTTTHLLERAKRTSWERLALADLGTATVLIVGMGSIGRTVAKYLAPLGTTVVGVASHARDDLHGIDELASLLPDADAVVVLTPLTDATHHLISHDELAAMKDGAVLINAGRGAVVDTDALVSALGEGRISAVLDVTDPEPLPDGHPLWTAPGLLSITPHIAGASPAGHRGAAHIAVDQLGRWLAGEPLINVMVTPD